MKTLENWSTVITTLNKGTPEEHKVPMMCGTFDGKTVEILKITGYHPVTKVLRSHDLEFQLGETEPSYEKRFPKSKEEIHAALTRAVFAAARIHKENRNNDVTKA